MSKLEWSDEHSIEISKTQFWTGWTLCRVVPRSFGPFTRGFRVERIETDYTVFRRHNLFALYRNYELVDVFHHLSDAQKCAEVSYMMEPRDEERNVGA